jgi:hypothetical protein
MSVSFWPFFGLVEAPERNGAVGRPSSSIGASERVAAKKLRKSAAKTLESLVRVN